MSNDALLDRFLICNAELSGIKLAERLQPTKPIEDNSLPLAYMKPLGMTQPTPRQQDGAGEYVIVRRYQLVIMVEGTEKASIDDSTEGSRLLALVNSFIDVPIDYYMKHPHLDTDAFLAGTQPTQGELGFTSDLTIQDNGPEVFKGVDGRNYAGTRPIITIAERRIPSYKRLS